MPFQKPLTTLTYRGDKSTSNYHNHKNFPEGKSGSIYITQEKNLPHKIFMEKVYHIYAKDKCLFHSLKEEEFALTWKTIHRLVGIMKTEYTETDLSFIELTANKETIINSSH